MKFLSIILAAGKGTRLGEKLKLTREVNGIAIIERIINILKEINLKTLLILGHKKEEVLSLVKEEYVVQEEQKGTAHALMQAEAFFKEYDYILVLPGDAPLIEKEILKSLIEKHIDSKADATILTTQTNNPKGYGRIVKENGKVKEIVEEKNCDDKLRKIKEVNAGIYCFKAQALEKNLSKIKQQHEYLLTDIFRLIIESGGIVEAIKAPFSFCQGINTLAELIKASNILRERKIKNLINSGVEIIDPKNSYIDEKSIIEKDAIIYPNATIENSYISSNSCIRGNTRIKNSFIESNVEIESSLITDSKIRKGAKVGPFAHIRGNTSVDENCRIGNFVEIARSNIGKEVKIAHMSYIGDSIIENEVNIGAGVITCNYDGKNKHKTLIKEKAFIGSNSNLIAPLEIGKKAFIAAGATVTKNIDNELIYISKKETLIKKREDE